MNAAQASEIMTAYQARMRDASDRKKHYHAWSILDQNIFKRIQEAAERGEGEVMIRTFGWDDAALAVVPTIVSRLEVLGYVVRGVGAAYTVNWASHASL